ncbi:MAG: AMP-binding protein [Alphaproteobacteria bacterium]|nr:AMP-binding protein [Alphaproteobacteria bacterium]
MFGNIAEPLAHHAERKPDHPALMAADRTVDYRELDDLVSRTAAYLRERGAGPGDIVGLALGDGIDHVVVMLGLARAGAVMLPLDWRWSAEEKSRVAHFFNAKSVLTDDSEAGIPGVDEWVVNDAWHEAVARSEPARDFPSDGEAPLLLSLSSGTTGRPKGPLLRHRQMILRFQSQWVTLGLNEHDRFLCATPLYFGGARGYTLSYLFMGGTVMVFPPPYTPEELVEAVRSRDVSTLFLVPTLLRRLLQIPWEGKLLMPGPRLLISSGSSLYAEERNAVMERITPHFVNAFSSTEGGPVSLLTPSHRGKHAGSVGRPVFMTEVEIVDDDGNRLASGQTGRIRQRSPWLPEGFHNDPEETAKAFRDGWYYTGDLGRMEEDGFLYLTGRTKDMIIRGGVNIYPPEIEETLLQHASVRDAAAVAWPSLEFGEEIAAFVVADGAADEAVLIGHCRLRLAPYKAPRRIFFVDELPRNPGGKVVKAKLAERLPVIGDGPVGRSGATL